jgi:hypothetical protein
MEKFELIGRVDMSLRGTKQSPITRRGLLREEHPRNDID